MEIKVVNGKVVVELSGSIYVESAGILREKLLKYIEDGHKNFVIKLDNVDYIDSSGLGVLVAIQKRVRQTGGRVTIAGATGVIKELFELTRLNKVFDMQ